jgi:hypothetical protein
MVVNGFDGEAQPLRSADGALAGIEPALFAEPDFE